MAREAKKFYFLPRQRREQKTFNFGLINVAYSGAKWWYKFILKSRWGTKQLKVKKTVSLLRSFLRDRRSWLTVLKVFVFASWPWEFIHSSFSCPLRPLLYSTLLKTYHAKISVSSSSKLAWWYSDFTRKLSSFFLLYCDLSLSAGVSWKLKCSLSN